MTLRSSTSAAEEAPGPSGAGPTRFANRFGIAGLMTGTVWLGLVGSVLASLASFGAGGVLHSDPLLDGTPLAVIRYGHGHQLATITVFVGVGLLLWAWVRLGRDALTATVSPRHVLAAAAVWTAPMLVCPPLFTRDAYIYLAQGALVHEGLDPYDDAPVNLDQGEVPDNVHPVWQRTPTPYGPLFMLLARGVYAVTGDNALAGVLLFRAVLLLGLPLLAYALPRLADHLGGSRAVALWLVVANPVMVIHLVGGPHNDLMVVGLLAVGALLMMRRRPVCGIAVVTLAGAMKATALLALPFMVLLWAALLPYPQWWRRLLRAGVQSVAIFGAVFGALTLVAGNGLGWLHGLSSPSKIVNWASWPTGAGQLAHRVTFGLAERRDLIDVFRTVGLLVLAGVALWQWWQAREGGPDAVRRTGVVLLLTAFLSPVTLPWYPSWGAALLAGIAWSPRGAAVAAAVTAFLLTSSFPTGDTSLYDPFLVAIMAATMALAAWSMLRPDPLRLFERVPDGSGPTEPVPVAR